MKKLNVICASIAALFAVGTAHAGSATTTPVTVAVENFGPTSTSTLAVKGGSITYSMSSISAVNAGSTAYFTVRLSGGKFAAAPAVGQFKFVGFTCGGADVACVVTLSTDKSTVKVAVTPVATATLGLGAFAYTPAATDINSVNTQLNTVGNVVSASIGLTTLDPSNIESTTTQSNIDGALGTGTIVTAARAITPSASAPTSTVKIDLTATPAGSAYTAGANARAPLAKVRFTAVAGVRKADDSGDYVLTGNTAVATTLTPGASQSFPVGAVLNAYTGADCATLVTGAGAGTTVTTGNAASALTVTVTNTPAVVSGTDYFICMTAPTSPNLATPIVPTISATVTPATSTDAIGAATGTGYSLQYNGSEVEVLTYWPGALDAFSYKGYLRITNTGTVSAAVSAQHRNTSGALVGAAQVITTLAAGQSVLISTKTIDTQIGANPSNLESGRIRITAPTDGLRVQALLQTGSDAPIEYRANTGN